MIKGYTHGQGEQAILKRLYPKYDIDIKWVDSTCFVDGKWYHNPIGKPWVIQNNWIVGNKAKIKRAKTFGHWFLNDKGNCRD